MTAKQKRLNDDHFPIVRARLNVFPVRGEPDRPVYINIDGLDLRGVQDFAMKSSVKGMTEFTITFVGHLEPEEAESQRPDEERNPWKM